MLMSTMLKHQITTCTPHPDDLVICYAATRHNMTQRLDHWGKLVDQYWGKKGPRCLSPCSVKDTPDLGMFCNFQSISHEIVCTKHFLRQFLQSARSNVPHSFYPSCDDLACLKCQQVSPDEAWQCKNTCLKSPKNREEECKIMLKEC